jgi:hypothetical protein
MTRFTFIVAGAIVFLAGSPAAIAAPPEFPHGAGVCVSQVAIDPSVVGASRLGEVVSSVAGPGQPGSDVPGLIDSARGDGPSGCGAPPGPHQSGP